MDKYYHVTYYGFKGKEIVAKMGDALTEIEIKAVQHNVKQFIIDNHPKGSELGLTTAFLSVTYNPADDKEVA